MAQTYVFVDCLFKQRDESAEKATEQTIEIRECCFETIDGQRKHSQWFVCFGLRDNVFEQRRREQPFPGLC